MALRFVGFNLDQIKELLSGSSLPLVAALRMQREVIARQKRRFESALAAIDQANLLLSRDESTDLWEILRSVIGVFKVQNDWEWTKKYYSNEACEKIEERLQNAPQVAEQGQRDWAALLAEVEEAATRRVAPSSEEARSAGRPLERLARAVHARRCRDSTWLESTLGRFNALAARFQAAVE